MLEKRRFLSSARIRFYSHLSHRHGATSEFIIADDHEIVRQKGVRNLVENEPGIEVCGEATSGRDVVDLAVTHCRRCCHPRYQYAWSQRHRGGPPDPQGQPKRSHVLMFTMHDAEHNWFARSLAREPKAICSSPMPGGIWSPRFRTVASGSHYFSSRLVRSHFRKLFFVAMFLIFPRDSQLKPSARETRNHPACLLRARAVTK